MVYPAIEHGPSGCQSMDEKQKDALKITNQFRNKRSLVYDLKGNGSKLTLSVSPRESDKDDDEWRIEAVTRDAPDAPPVVAWGATRTAALHTLGTRWGAEADSQGLPRFDWDDVARVLVTVRAL